LVCSTSTVLDVTFLGKLGKEELDQVSLGEVVKSSSCGSRSGGLNGGSLNSHVLLLEGGKSDLGSRGADDNLRKGNRGLNLELGGLAELQERLLVLGNIE